MRLTLKYRRAIRACVSGLLAIMAVAVFYPAPAQNRKELERQRRAKEREIHQTRQRLNDTRTERKNTLQYLQDLNTQIRQRQDYLTTLQSQNKILSRNIERQQDMVDALTADLESLKEEYAGLIYDLYRNRGEFNALSYVLDTRNFNESVRRARLLRFYVDHRRRQMELVRRTQDNLDARLAELRATYEDKKLVADKVSTEAGELEKNKAEKNEVARKLKARENDLRRELRIQRKAAERLDMAIRAAIQREVAAAGKRAGTASSKDARPMTKEEKMLSGSFAGNKGKLPWPVDKGRIVERFGRHAVEGMDDLVVDSKGLKFSLPQGETANAIFGGEVSRVVRIPNAGIAVILRHGDYFTVYSGLSTTSVSMGDKVKTGHVLGKVEYNKITERYELTLQIWSGREILNPEHWIRK